MMFNKEIDWENLNKLPKEDRKILKIFKKDNKECYDKIENYVFIITGLNQIPNNKGLLKILLDYYKENNLL